MEQHWILRRNLPINWHYLKKQWRDKRIEPTANKSHGYYTKKCYIKMETADHVSRYMDGRLIKKITENGKKRERSPTRWASDEKCIVGNWVTLAEDRIKWMELEQAYVQQCSTMSRFIMIVMMLWHIFWKGITVK